MATANICHHDRVGRTFFQKRTMRQTVLRSRSGKDPGLEGNAPYILTENFPSPLVTGTPVTPAENDSRVSRSGQGARRTLPEKAPKTKKQKIPSPFSKKKFFFLAIATLFFRIVRSKDSNAVKRLRQLGNENDQKKIRNTREKDPTLLHRVILEKKWIENPESTNHNRH